MPLPPSASGTASEITALPNGGLEIILPKNAALTLAPAN
jgi:hypothetical protein